MVVSFLRGKDLARRRINKLDGPPIEIRLAIIPLAVGVQIVKFAAVQGTGPVVAEIAAQQFITTDNDLCIRS